jgi:protein-tyrosine-phosphatase
MTKPVTFLSSPLTAERLRGEFPIVRQEFDFGVETELLVPILLCSVTNYATSARGELMNVLFICFANVARSQIAEACFKAISRHHCDSAGIAVDDRIAKDNLPSRKVKDAPTRRSIEYVKREFGVDIGEKERQQLIPEMIDTADVTVVIAEKNRWPDYLKESAKVMFWDIPDPFGETDAFADDVYKQVQKKVEQLVAEIG